MMSCTPDGAGCALTAPGGGFASVADALQASRAAAAYLNSPAAGGLDGPARGEALEQLGAITSLLGAASNAILRRFDAGDDHDADGYATSAAWLAGKTHLGRKDAKAAVRQMRLLGRHPVLDAATAAGTLTISWAREIAGWTGRIDHHELRQQADQILAEAAAGGADLDDLRLLAQAAYEAWRAQDPDPDDDPAGRGFGDRYLQLDTTLDDAGHLRGDLTPECAAALTAVIEALGKNRGPQDLRTTGQRYHDALQEACELLIRARMAPDRAGADTRVDVTIPLRDLLAMDGASLVEDAWLRARAGEHGYLSGADAEAIACDALIVPVVTGSPDWKIITQMITLITDAYGHLRPAAQDQPAQDDPGQDGRRPGPQPLPPRRGRPCSTPSPACPSSSSPGPARSPPPCAAACTASRSTPAASSSTSATPTRSRNRSARPSSPATRAAPGPAAATAAPPTATSTTSSTNATAAKPAPPTASCSANTTTTSASTDWAGTSNSCPTDQPAPAAPTARPSSAATDHHRQPNQPASTATRRITTIRPVLHETPATGSTTTAAGASTLRHHRPRAGSPVTELSLPASG